MSVQDIVLAGGGGAFVLLTLLQIAPIKINPWSAIAKTVGRAINAEVLKELDEMKSVQKDTRERLERHIEVDNERDADSKRASILQFNMELVRNLRHTREDFIEVLTHIDAYEQFCTDHPNYTNSRAVIAIANIKRVYEERLQKNDFAM